MTLAVLPARGGSRRIERKNLILVAGAPLIGWAIRIVRESGAFDRVVVSTDDPEIADVARRWGAELPFLRDPALADDYASTTDVLVDALTRVADGATAGVAACVYPTALLADPERLAEAVQWMRDPTVDSVMTVTAFPVSPARAWRIAPNGCLMAIDPEAMATRTQDLVPAWQDAGQWYVVRTQQVLGAREMLGRYCRPMQLPAMEAQDIDTPDDLALATWKHGRLARWMRRKTDVLFRVDCGPGIGTGHVFRCLAIAEVLQARGLSVVMHMSDPSPALVQRAEAIGVVVEVLPDEARLSWCEDASWCLRHAPAPGQGLLWVVVDHYELDHRWHAALRSTGARILVVDDLGGRPLDADIILNQVPLERVHSACEAQVIGQPRLLFGPRWTLLRREFQAVELMRRQRRPGTPPAVLLFCGGEDHKGLTTTALDALSRRPAEVEPLVLLGHAYPHPESVVERCERLGVVCHVAHPQPSTLLGQVDVVVATCGMFALEAHACGLPLVLVSVSDIQQEVAESLAREARVVHLPQLALGDPDVLLSAITAVLSAYIHTPPATTFDAAERLVDLMLPVEPTHA